MVIALVCVAVVAVLYFLVGRAEHWRKSVGIYEDRLTVGRYGPK